MDSYTQIERQFIAANGEDEWNWDLTETDMDWDLTEEGIELLPELSFD